MGRPRKVVKHNGVVASVVEGENLLATETNKVPETLEEEVEEAKSERAKHAVKEDQFTNLLKKVLGLKGNPQYKVEFCDPRWPRMDNGALVTVSRAYYPAVEGPRKESFGIRSLGEREIEQIRVIIDQIPDDKFWTKERILAKKWVCESSGYRYFWIQKGEELEFDLDDPKNVFFERFEPMKEKPEFNWGPVGPPKDLQSKTFAEWL